MGNDFKIILEALLDQSSLTEIEKKLAKKKIQVGLDIDFANSIKESEKQIKDLATRFKDIFNFKTDTEAMAFTKKYISQANSLIKENERVTAQAEKEKQKELEKTVALYNKQQQAKERAEKADTNTRTSNANSILTDQISSLNKIADLRAKISTQKSSGNDSQVSVLQKQLSLEQENYKMLTKEASYYTDIISNEERRKALKSESLNAELKVQQAEAKVSDTNTAQAEKAKNDELQKQLTLVEKINAEQNGTAKRSIAVDMASTTKTYTELEKLGTVSDKVKNDFAELKIAHDALGNSISDEELIANYEKFNTQLAKVNNSLKQTKLNTTSVSSESLKLDKATFSNQVKAWVRVNSGAKEFHGKMNEILAQVDSVDNVSGLTNLRKQFQAVNAEAKSAGALGKNLFDSLKEGMSSFTTWTTGAAIVMNTVQAGKDLVNTAVDINKAVVDLQMATGDSAGSVEKLMNSYIDLGEELHTTGTDVAAAASDYLRQGKSVAETNTLIRDSVILAKDGQVETADATTYLTTAMKGYHVEAQNVIGIVDKLTAVDMASATSAGGLAEGMAEVATNADLAGVSMDKLLGYLAIIGETTGEGMSSVGNSLSTMFSRMGNIKLSRLKDYQNNGEDLSNVETVLRGEGIALRDSTDTFRNFGEVLDEVSGKWSGYSDVSQRAIASAIAGKDHMEDFLVLMSNYGKATEYSTVAMESSGTAMEKFANYEEGIEGKLEGLKNSLQELSNDSINSDFLKGLIDTGNGAINILDALIDKFGILGTAIGVGGGILGAKNLGGSKMFDHNKCAENISVLFDRKVFLYT